MFEVQELEPRIILGLKVSFISASHEGSNAHLVIGPLWQEMSKLFFSLKPESSIYPNGVGAMWPDESGTPGSMYYFAGYEVSDVPEDLGGLEVLHLEGGKYAFVTHLGPMSDLSNSVIDFYTRVLPESNLPRRAGIDLELYREEESDGDISKVIIAAPVQ
jgi:predicted transcriptional regulator YdeE